MDENSAPLEALRQQAKVWLRQAQELLESGTDPVFQLMLWGLDQGIKCNDPEYTGQIREAVDVMTYQWDDPDQALRYLVESHDHPEEWRVDVQELAHQRSPKQASILLLTALDMALSADPGLPGWPP